jgi:flagellar motor switch protein FliN
MDDTSRSAPLPVRDGSAILGQVPIEITVSVGFARPMVRDLMGLRRDAVLPLDRRIDDPVELYIGDKLIARGELQELEGEQAGYLGVRLTELVKLDEML